MDTADRFFKLLDDLEENLDRGFFLSFIGKIIVDEKKIYSVLNELRSLNPEGLKAFGTKGHAAPPPEPPPKPAPTPIAPTVITPESRHLITEAEQKAVEIRDGADHYADEVLSDLEDRLTKLLTTIREGKRVLKTRNGSEVT